MNANEINVLDVKADILEDNDKEANVVLEYLKKKKVF